MAAMTFATNMAAGTMPSATARGTIGAGTIPRLSAKSRHVHRPPARPSGAPTRRGHQHECRHLEGDGGLHLAPNEAKRLQYGQLPAATSHQGQGRVDERRHSQQGEQAGKHSRHGVHPSEVGDALGWLGPRRLAERLGEGGEGLHGAHALGQAHCEQVAGHVGHEPAQALISEEHPLAQSAPVQGVGQAR